MFWIAITQYLPPEPMKLRFWHANKQSAKEESEWLYFERSQVGVGGIANYSTTVFLETNITTYLLLE